MGSSNVWRGLGGDHGYAGRSLAPGSEAIRLGQGWSLGSSSWVDPLLVRCEELGRRDRLGGARQRRVRLPGARWRAKNPGRGGDEEENERSRDSSGGIAGEGVGRGGASQVEEDAGIGPLFQAREPRSQQRRNAEDLPGAQDGEHVARVAERDRGCERSRVRGQLRGAGGQESGSEEARRYPVSNYSWLGLHGSDLQCACLWAVGAGVSKLYY